MMPNDARLGLVVGVGVVIAVAVIYYRKAPESAAGAGEPAPALTAHAKTPGRTTSRPLRRHVVAEGETLTSLARQYYGDADKVELLQRANADVVGAVDEVPSGLILVIPEAE
jgi:nucleoid-associated protein YgaU